MRSNKSSGETLTRTQRARREDLIGAAVDVINREGYAAASVDRIARHAGTSKGTVLYHFRSKQGLDEAVVSALYDAGAAVMGERLREAGSSRERLRVYLDANLRFVAAHVAHVAAVQRILLGAGLVGELDVDASVPLARILADGQAAGELGEFDPALMALAVRAVVDRAAFHLVEHPGTDLDRYVAETARLFDLAVAPTGRTAQEDPS
ncbi:TetR family transcriptional regulator [Luteimicrobium album]|uniref:TetR family transcriptional regulator n=1 Tax=Luteimicrobium album TaxID=1054550 RepID=A0ABQ6I1E1_9MICO|nr:TetR/AcrR family transcriptional regulator [Luteimicrobium album]GMA24032.1 TetR family transcriptional regulator [Luteimicrobium album]